MDGRVNSIGLAAGVVGFAILIGAAAPRSGFALKASLVVYGGALVAMLGCSALYNAKCESRRRDLFRRLERSDEAAEAYRRALELTTNASEIRFLEQRLAEVT